jgi:hypothetical protein
MNAVAHYQHHYWTEHRSGPWKADYPVLFSKRNPVSERNLHPGDDPIAHGLKCYDGIVGAAIAAAGIDSVVVLTGLSQVPFEGYAEESGFYLYRPIEHDRLFAALGLPCSRIAPLMSRDAMLYFANEADRTRALDILGSAQVNGLPVFQFSAETDLRVFAKVVYSYDVQADSAVTALGLAQPLPWAEHFTLITFKTGHHHPEGSLIAPRRGLQGLLGEGQALPLARFPELVLRMLEVRDADTVARRLAFSPA